MPDIDRLVIAVDPGKVTGIATWLNGEMTSWQEQTWYAVDKIWTKLERADTPIEAVVCESYKITASTLHKTRQYYSLESIGALRWMATRHSVEFILQDPADAMRFMTDDKLRMMGWYHYTVGGHANDAARHLGLYIAKTDPKTFKKLLRVG